VISREAVDDTRIVAIGLLEKHANRKEALEVLSSAAGKWSNSQAVRQAAAAAASAVKTRLGVR
jgi:hypothetical protein